MVLGHDRPSIGQLSDLRPARIDHRLDGEGHAGFKFQAGACLAIVQDLRLFVKAPADAVAAELSDNGVAGRFGEFLYGSANIAQPLAWCDLRNARPHGLVGEFAEPFGSDGGLTNKKHTAGVPVKAVLNHGDVDVHDVRGLQDPVARNAVADLVINRGADRFWVGLIARGAVVQGGGNRALHIDHVVMAEPVELPGGDPGPDMGANEVQDFGGETARDPHGVDFGARFELDGHKGLESQVAGSH